MLRKRHRLSGGIELGLGFELEGLGSAQGLEGLVAFAQLVLNLGLAVELLDALVD
jgi:hypothetical protein